MNLSVNAFLSYLNVSMILDSLGRAPFYPANLFWGNCKSLIAEPRSDSDCSYEQRILGNHNWILFIAVSLWFGSIAKYKRPIFKGYNSLYYWASLNLLKVDCFWSCLPCTQATCLFCLPTIFVAYLDNITAYMRKHLCHLHQTVNFLDLRIHSSNEKNTYLTEYQLSQKRH